MRAAAAMAAVSVRRSAPLAGGGEQWKGRTGKAICASSERERQEMLMRNEEERERESELKMMKRRTVFLLLPLFSLFSLPFPSSYITADVFKRCFVL